MYYSIIVLQNISLYILDYVAFAINAESSENSMNDGFDVPVIVVVVVVSVRISC